MKLLIANVSTKIGDAQLSKVVGAIAEQVSRDFTPEWHIRGTLSSERLDLGNKRARLNTPTDAVIYLGDQSQDPTRGVKDASGYHDTNHRNAPYGFVYLDVCAKTHDKWSSVLSHEVLELLGDPSATLSVSGPRPLHSHSKRQTAYYDLEVCDPTQGDEYEIDGVVVSNFVTRAYFGIPGGASAATNHLKLPLASFGVRPGGYFQYEDERGAHEVDGEEVTSARREARLMLAGYRRNSRRLERLRTGFAR